MFYLGLDLGQSVDYTALAVLEDVGQDYHCRHLERFNLGTSYPMIVKRVFTLLDSEPIRDNGQLIVDATGVGAPVVDLLEDAYPVAVTITGGDVITQEGRKYRVPKRDLITTVQVMLQSERLKFAQGMPGVTTLINELLAYRVTINALTAHDSYNAREGEHDDLVLALALAAWYAEQSSNTWLIS